MDRKALLFAAMTAVTITLYTISDGIGARISGDPHGYTAALFLLDGICLAAFALWWKGREGLKPMLAYLPQVLRAGPCPAAPMASRSGR